MTILTQGQVTAICENGGGDITERINNVRDNLVELNYIGSVEVMDMTLIEITALRAENARKDDLIERLKLEAQIHAQEARTQKSIVNECLQAASGGSKTKGNWNGSRPIKERITVLEAENARLREALEPFANPPAYVFNGDSKFVPANMPDDWMGGGWFATADFRKARQVLGADK